MTDFEPGWPCVAEDAIAPPVTDQLSNPSGDDILPQILALTPRGAAWGTDEAGDGSGASPLMRLFWSAIADWAAASYRTDFELAQQALPSEITWSLDDWENDYGLPDPCLVKTPVVEQRRQAVRQRYAAFGGQSINYFICLAQSLGFTITIEEFTPARVGAKCGTPLYGPAWAFAWRITSPNTVVTYARVGWSRIGDRLAAWGNSILECVIRRAAPAHTIPIFAYTGDAPAAGLDEFELDHSGLT